MNRRTVMDALSVAAVPFLGGTADESPTPRVTETRTVPPGRVGPGREPAGHGMVAETAVAVAVHNPTDDPQRLVGSVETVYGREDVARTVPPDADRVYRFGPFGHVEVRNAAFEFDGPP